MDRRRQPRTKKLSAKYDDNGRVTLSLNDIIEPRFFGVDKVVRGRHGPLREEVRFLVTSQVYSSSSSTLVTEATPQHTPIRLIETKEFSGFEAILLKPSPFIRRAINLFIGENEYFTITPPEDHQPICRILANLKSNSDYFHAKTRVLIDFLTFVKGDHVGFGHVHAFTPDKKTAFWLLGFTHTDFQERQGNWFDIFIQPDLGDIFSKFVASYRDEITKTALRQAINFYRASNASREVSVEMSLVASHCALEALVNYILKERAGWSKSKCNSNRIKFAEKCQEATACFGLEGNILEKNPSLQKYSREKGKNAFEIISTFRNKLVHQDETHKATGLQLHEVWNLAQWLVEVLIFGIIGHRGKIVDRRIIGGWRGETTTIPLKVC